ncbi:MAG TPA: AAA family ATPase [Candidatus Polarisedimenticolia bacterium]|nr:AAA family ATPase [Candidatus Polarisedimenticolia bacterium]
MSPYALLLWALIIAAVVLTLRRRSSSARSRPAATPGDRETKPDASGQISAGGVTTDKASAAPGIALSRTLHEVAEELSKFFDKSALPADLLANTDFRGGVDLLARDDADVDMVLSYVTGDNSVISCMASEALRERKERGETPDRVIEAVGGIGGWPLFFALRYLADAVPAREPLVGRILSRAGGAWDHRFARGFLKDFVALRMAAGEKPTLGAHLQGLSRASLGAVDKVLKSLGPEAGALRDEYESFRKAWIDVEYLAGVGTLWSADAAERAAIIEHDALQAAVAGLEASYLAGRPRSTLLVGEPGVGKSAIARALAGRMRRAGWIVFQAGAAELLAGQIFIGQLEERMQEVLRHVSRPRRVLWVIPDFPTLALAGRHKYSQVGVLDLILPLIEQGTITVLGECQPAAYERLLLEKSRCATALTALRVEPLSEAETLRLARQWIMRHAPAGAASPSDPDAVIHEAAQLALQFLGHKGMPGSVLELLRVTCERLAAGAAGGTGPAGASPPITADDLIVTLSQMTGLPAHILDDREALDLAALRSLFEERVKGQREAVDCLVDRVAMIKAGVTDPTRPSGVFLFAGPTGTGKTEIAKTLAEFLFGSPERMIRLDMSEFQSIDSLDRILGATGDERADSFADQVRRQPFSVVLLDEFEKAHERVWDIFLQVFDDGRLTDRRGKTADVRHAIIILTSNLGGAIPSGLSLGFSKEHEGFRAGVVTRTIGKSFRKEFLNRIDRVVVFQPLSREVMRQILYRELSAALQRRGLRSRAWAVEWDESAIEFLLGKGFTEDLGARPLKRAIERYLLAPLATTIVNRQVPAGDQFLLVTGRDDRLELEFIDPDAPQMADEVATPLPVIAADSPAPPGATPAGTGLGGIALQPGGRREEADFLRARLVALCARVESGDWKEDKARALEETGRPDFWASPGRFEILGRYEYRDRIESGVQRAGSLLDRLVGRAGDPRSRYPRHLVGALAHNLYLLETACADLEGQRPREAFLLVEAKSSRGAPAPETDRFAAELAAMYRSWAAKRRMRVQVLDERPANGQPFRFLMAVSGFGAYSILAPEDGLHVLEQPEDRPHQFDRCHVQVSVVPQPLEPAGDAPRALRSQAERALEQLTTRTLRVVRRYRRDPSPLVRDGVRRYRTGRLDLVLGGDFDLLGGGPVPDEASRD